MTLDLRPPELWERKRQSRKPPRSPSLSFGFCAKSKQVQGGRRRQLLFCPKSNVLSETVRPPETTAPRHGRPDRRPDAPVPLQAPPCPGSAFALPREGQFECGGATVDHLAAWRSLEARGSQPPLANELKNELWARPAGGRGGSSSEPLADTPLNKSAARERDRAGERATHRKKDPDPVPKYEDSGEGTDVNIFFSSCVK